MSPVVVTDRKSLLERREAILDQLGMSLADFEALAASRSLSGKEWDAREELDEIAFLLGEDN